MPSNILVTGSGGYIGSVLRFSLGAAGIDLGLRGPPVSWEGETDVRRVDSAMLRRAGIDTIVHTAAIAHEPDAGPYIGEMIAEQNAWAAHNIISEAQLARCRTFVLFSTMVVYPPSPRPQTEDSPVQPFGVYARSKLRAEKLLQQATDIPRRIVLRCGTVFGPSFKPRFSSFVDDILYQARYRKEVRLISSGRQRRSVLRLSTLDRVLTALLCGLPDGYHVFNVADGALTIRSWARLVARYYKVPLSIGVGGDAGRVIDCSKLWRRFGSLLRPHPIGSLDMEMNFHLTH